MCHRKINAGRNVDVNLWNERKLLHAYMQSNIAI